MLFFSLILAGAAEGSLLALGQSWALRQELAAFSTRSWVIATALAAAFAWALDLIPSTFGDRLTNLPPLVLVPVAVALGLALLLSLGACQWLVLRRYVSGSVVWIPANVIAWFVGLATSVSLISVLVSEETSARAAVAIRVPAGLLMGAALRPPPDFSSCSW